MHPVIGRRTYTYFQHPMGHSESQRSQNPSQGCALREEEGFPGPLVLCFHTRPVGHSESQRVTPIPKPLPGLRRPGGIRFPGPLVCAFTHSRWVTASHNNHTTPIIALPCGRKSVAKGTHVLVSVYSPWVTTVTTSHKKGHSTDSQ